MATKTRSHTLTMFRDNADTNAIFTQQVIDGDNTLHIEKAEDDGDTKSLFSLANNGFSLLQHWADNYSDTYTPEVILSGPEDAYQLKIAPSKMECNGLKFVKCLPGGKKKTLLVLDDHQTRRFISWLNRTHS
jgi:hypothetical protein